MKRPNINDYLTTPNEVLKSETLRLFKYILALNEYADALENSLANDGEALTFMKIELDSLRAELSERKSYSKANNKSDIKALRVIDIMSNLICDKCHTRPRLFIERDKTKYLKCQCGKCKYLI